ncbi:SDR family NAD(P)-dependent oxidoreductase [Nocardiopsis changdeensis]|uniref:SDR family NAD(P)-dependent oxidoreductase n=1 Tax=Nocardiopsis changdeensis TaxID=2831969 RepID=UPI003F4888A6
MTDDARLLDYLKRVTADLRRTRAELDGLRSRGTEPIAIVGMGCRFPGGTDTPEALWRLVEGRGDAIGGIPDDRGWDVASLTALPGGTGAGGFLDDVTGFDAEFFGISAREAAAMDPQHRLMLEVSWEALERAGIDPTSLADSSTGVFTGISVSDYGGAATAGALPVPEEAQGYLLTGTSTGVASGRVAYTLGLSGPALTVDTACSSSLVAVHLAVRSLRSGECDLALAGGATVMSGPALFTEFARQGGLAADGRCKAFGAAADGAGFSEGAGAVVLERLSDARRNGHRVLALIRGTAINQDGASNGLTAPSGPAQVRVVRSALADAGLDGADIDAVEAHGTGTRLGDPIEAQALIEVFGSTGGREVGIGSLKSNIGHTQAASGVAGLMKMVLALDRGVLPASLHADTPTPLVDWSAGRVRVLSRARDWPRGERPRRAGVSSFGISGTNAHVVLEEAPQDTSDQEGEAPALVSGPVPWVLSARTGGALADQAARLGPHLEETGADDPADVARALATTRSVFAHRAVVLGGDTAELAEGLRALADGRSAENVVAGAAPRGGRASAPVFVFPGQGGQWEGMAAGLMASSPRFAASVAECARALDPFVDWSLEEVLRGAPGAPAVTGGDARVDVVQPALWAVMVSLARLWREAGVEPAAVVGHSQGEIAAACVAGALSLEDGARIVAVRSRILRSLAGLGGMAAVAVGPERAAALASRWAGRIGVAAVNGPESTVVSGDQDAITELVAACEGSGVHVRRVDVDYASHSAHVERVREELLADLAGIRPGPTRVPFHSTVSPHPGWSTDSPPAAEPVRGERLDAEYWYRNLRNPVLLAPVVDRLAERSGAFVEVGPHPVLSSAVERTLESGSGPEPAVLTTLRRGEDSAVRFITALAEAHCRGVGVDWARVTGGGRARIVLPTYPFQHRPHRLPDLRPAAEPAALGVADTGHPLLRAHTPIAGTGQTLFTGVLDTDRHPWLTEHVVGGRPLLPGTAILELLLHTGHVCGCPEIADLTVTAPVEIPGDGPVTRLQVLVDAPDEQGRRAVRLSTLAPDGGAWTVHARGELAPEGGRDAAPVTAAGTDAVPLPVADAYELFAAHGYHYGPAFRGLAAAWVDRDGIGAEAAVAPQPGTVPGPHPASVDAALHALLLHHLSGEGTARPVLPFAWNGVRRHGTGTPSRLRVRMSRTGSDTWAVAFGDSDGTPVLSIDRLTVREAAPVPGTEPGALFHQEWTEAPAPGDAAPTALSWAAVGGGGPEGVPGYTDPVALTAALDEGAPVPELLVVPAGGGSEPERVHAELRRILQTVHGLQDDVRLRDSRVAVVTTGAVRVPEHPGDPDRVDLAGAAVWGLVSSAESEDPGRFLLVDTDRSGTDALAAALRTGEPRVAVRDGRPYVPRLAGAAAPASGLHAPPRHTAWRLDAVRPGRVDGLALVPDPGQDRPLEPGEIRIAVRAAGVNFRDVLITVGMYPEPGMIGNEGAGVVIETGPGVTDLAPGDRVMGIFPGAFAPTAVARRELVARVPADWDDAAAAAVPAAYLTAYLALVEEADLRRGQRVLVHSAAGGVGQAAVHLARYLGAEVLATASPEKWGLLRGLGIAEEHLAHSRDLGFEDRFRKVSPPVDVVLNSLTGKAIDASLRLTAPGGRFVELGRNDIRDPDHVRTGQGVEYRPFDLSTVGPERIRHAFSVLVPLLEKGELPGIGVTRFPVERAEEAFRLMQQGRNVGKVVLDTASRYRRDGTVLITGGTGTLGALIARHLVVRHGVTGILLAGRRGAGPRTVGLAAELSALGAEVRVAACDVADPDEVDELLRQVPDERPLVGVVHAAGVTDDATVAGLDPRTLDRVLRPKVDGAWNLHTATAGLDLDFFVLFSSAAGVFGASGQGGYAAANSYLDALAHYRRSSGLPAQSLSWGLWADESAMTARLGDAEKARMARDWGLAEAIGADEGCALMDAAAALDAPHLIPVPLDLAGLRTRAMRSETVPALLRGLAGAPSGAGRSSVPDPAARVRAAEPGARRRALLVELIRTRASEILGRPAGSGVGEDEDFLESGFDSLTAVELRNHLREIAGVRLPPAVVFSHRTPRELAAHVDDVLAGEGTGDPGPSAAREPSGGLVDLFREACRAGRPEAAVDLARAAARTRQAPPPGWSWPTGPTSLATGARTPLLVCVPSLVMISGAQEFSRFAAHFRGSRSVRALALPGFLDGEELPDDLSEFSRALADAVLAAADGSPFSLVGRSSGGWAAHAAAEELSRRGHAPSDLVLLDTPLPDAPGVLPIVTEAVTARAGEFELLDTAGLSAMGGYLELFARWRPGPLDVPTFQIRPTDPVRVSTGEGAGLGWTWPGDHRRIEVPGDHLSMMEAHASTTAEAVDAAVTDGPERSGRRRWWAAGLRRR